MKIIFLFLIFLFFNITYSQVINLNKDNSKKANSPNAPGSFNFLGESGANYSNNLIFPQINIVSATFLKNNNNHLQLPLNIITSALLTKPASDQDERTTVDILNPTGGVLNINFSVNWFVQENNENNIGFCFQPSVKLIQCKGQSDESLVFFGNSSINGYVIGQCELFSLDSKKIGVLFTYFGFGYNFSFGGNKNFLFKNNEDYSNDFPCIILKSGIRIDDRIDVSFGYVKGIAKQVNLIREELVSISTNLKF
jgi:hypothetical protein